ncbi:DUF6029 family protein [Candidatus Marinimicrobia bacterium]|nr:DUF6029 family protein [Candidatus Neomarinimicrobiota bacterium]
MIRGILLIIFFFTTVHSQTDISNRLSVRYGDSSNEYNYSEIYLDTKMFLQREGYRIESLFTFEASNPPEIGLDINGLDRYLIGFYNDKFSFEVGDIHQTWGRGLLLNQLNYQNLDFATGSRGLGMQFDNDSTVLNVIMGDVSARTSTTVLGNYNPRIPNHFVEEFIYGADLSTNILKSKVGAAFLLVDEKERSLSHVLSNLRIDRSYESGEFFMSLISKSSKKDNGMTEIFYEEKNGIGFYLSSSNYIQNWSITSSYRNFKVDINNPVNRDNMVDNYGRALDIQRSPSGFYEHTFRLLSRSSREVNLNDEVGIEIQLLGSLSNNSNIAVNYMKSSSSKRWYNGIGALTSDWSGDNIFMPSSSQSSYPFEEIFIEFNGYNPNGNIFYKAGLDFQHEVFNVLSNSTELKSFEISESVTVPFLVNVNVNSLWNIEVQLELQKLKTGFETTSESENTEDNYSYTSLLSEKYQKNLFLALSANYNQKWSFNLSRESTNSDESLLDNGQNESFDSANDWSSTSIAYKFDSDHTLELFFGSIRGGLDCTNGVCRYIQAFDDGIRIDYSLNID